MTVERRDFKAAAIGVALLIIGLVAVAAAAFWLHRWHRADLAALHRSPSYIYGERTLDRMENEPSMPDGTREGCQIEFLRHPATFAGYQESVALQGCLDENNRINY